MNDYFRRLYAFNQSYFEKLLADISDDEMLLQPSADVNPPTWQLGHLAICTDYAIGITGGEHQLPKTWHVFFGPGSKAMPGDRTWPGRQELWDAYVAGHAAVDAACHDIAPELLTKPNPIDFLIELLPTTGDLLAHLMTTHESAHLGHLSSWRRQLGRKPLF